MYWSGFACLPDRQVQPIVSPISFHKLTEHGVMKLVRLVIVGSNDF